MSNRCFGGQYRRQNFVVWATTAILLCSSFFVGNIYAISREATINVSVTILKGISQQQQYVDDNNNDSADLGSIEMDQLLDNKSVDITGLFCFRSNIKGSQPIVTLDNLRFVDRDGRKQVSTLENKPISTLEVYYKHPGKKNFSKMEMGKSLPLYASHSKVCDREKVTRFKLQLSKEFKQRMHYTENKGKLVFNVATTV